MNRFLSLLRQQGLSGWLARTLLLSGLLGMAFLVCAFWTASNPDQFIDCQNAFLAVLLTSVLAHLLAEFPRGDKHVLLRLTGPIWVRTGLLLLFLTPGLSGDLLNDSYIYYILAFYLVGLFSEVSITSLSTWRISETGVPVVELVSSRKVEGRR